MGVKLSESQLPPSKEVLLRFTMVNRYLNWATHRTAAYSGRSRPEVQTCRLANTFASEHLTRELGYHWSVKTSVGSGCSFGDLFSGIASVR